MPALAFLLKYSTICRFLPPGQFCGLVSQVPETVRIRAVELSKDVSIFIDDGRSHSNSLPTEENSITDCTNLLIDF
ncbi:hypothetical protein [Microcoleus sp. CZ3-B4]|uniref:hypothetical protein n=1 Tax=Microcoleus sp. CZ3-B4 TaxID=2818733 RepID=UPI002FD135BB